MSLAVKEIIALGRRQLEDAGIADADRDSKLLYCYMTNITNAQLILEYQNLLQDMLCDQYFQLIDRRSKGEPLQYIVGKQEFMGLDFKVNPSVLIPRQDTETLVEDAISLIKEGKIREEEKIKKKKNWEVLDLCCGSGAIGVSIAKLCPGTKVTLSDVSGDAIAVAKENAALNGLEKTVEFAEGDLFAPFKKIFKKKTFDLIISNPPYINSDVIPTLQTEVKDFEPVSALDGGEDGLDFYRRIIEEAPDFLKKGGCLMMEIGYDQKDRIIKLLEETERFENIEGYKDLAGLDRIVFAVLAGKKKK